MVTDPVERKGLCSRSYRLFSYLHMAIDPGNRHSQGALLWMGVA